VKRARLVTPTNNFEPFDLEDIKQSIPSRFEQQVLRYPDRLAVRSHDRSFTYAELNKAANRIADAILEQYGEGEEPVALLLDQGAWVVAAIMGVLKAGKIYVPLDPRFPRPRLSYIIEDSQTSLILTDSRNMSAAAELTPRKIPRINLHTPSSHYSSTNPAIAISPDYGVNIIYTSGSTGTPKGVLQNHRNLLFEVLRVTNSFHVCRDDRLALLHPCSSSASLRRIFPALLNGASLHPLDLRTVGLEDLPRWFEQEEITISNGRRLLRDWRHSLTGEDQFPRLRLVTFGGEPVYRSDVELYRRYLSPQCLMLINLAATETGSDCHYFIDKQTQFTDALIPVGYPTEGTEIFLLNENGQKVGPGEVGEIAVKSRYLSLGYWRQPELTRKRFLPDPNGGEARIYLSGDMGRMRSDGCLFYLGRKDFQVKVRGHRIEPIEVETALLNLGTFTEAVVLALGTVEDNPSGRFHLHAKSDNLTPTGSGETGNHEQITEPEEKRLVAYLVPARLPAPTVSDLRRSLSETLPEHMIPSVFVMREKFPRAPSGKVDHAALAAHFTASRPWRTRPTLARPFVAPRDAIEEVLAGIWAELLQIDTVGIEDSFFDMGGHSLMVVQLFRRIEREFGIRIPLSAIFQSPTVEKLAAVITNYQEPESQSSLVSIQPKGSNPPLFCVADVMGSTLIYRHLAKYLDPDQPVYGLEGAEDVLCRSIEEIAFQYVSELRGKIPNGPFMLIGFSSGGLVAFEMARQLQMMNLNVLFLGILDTSCPDRSKEKPKPWEAAMIRAFARNLPWWLYYTLPFWLSHYWTIANNKMKKTFLRKPYNPTEVSEESIDNLREIIRWLRRYTPQKYPGRITLYRARAQRLIPSCEDMEWSSVAECVGIQSIPGHHMSILKEPHVRMLAEKINRELKEIKTMSTEDSHAELQHLNLGIQQPPGVDNVADGYLESLNACAVDYIFINPGTDTVPIQESIAKFKVQGRRSPELILCLHESVAMAAAHGYFMVSGRPQVVLVHVDVGTQNIGANLHNAQRGRAGVVVCAGRAPYTVDGSLPGGRDSYIHWIQEQFSQESIVHGYVKWHYELTCRENLHLAVQRAFQVARTEPAGPVYLTLPREVLVQTVQTPIVDANRAPAISTLAVDPDSLSRAAKWLIEADRPLILVAYAGRNPKAAASLVRLAETLAAPVVESRHRVNFPSGHPLHLGFSAGSHLHRADCVLIVDHDVPWVPAQYRPPSACRIIHVDIDPLKRDIPIWGFPVDLAIQADSSHAMSALAEEVERLLSRADRTRIERRRHVLTAQHQAQRARWQKRAFGLAARQPIAPEWAAYCLSEIVDEDTVIVSEAVSNNQVLWRYLQLDTPGTYYQSLGSGLGWGLGAAFGAKLASPSKTIICTLGDGSWIFGSPLAAYWAAEQSRSPFLTIVFNNQAYAATTEAILGIAPDGYARRTGNYPGCDLPKPPLYSKMAEAMGLWARTVDDPAKLRSVLREALSEVRRGRSALVDICVSSPQTVGRMPEE